MKRKFLVGLAIGFIMLGLVGVANATPVYVGSWQVDEGLRWDTYNATTASALEIAAMLFGGNSLDYLISTVDNNPANIDHLAWYSAWGSGDPNIAPILPNGQYNFPAGSKLSESTVIDVNGNGLYDGMGDYSPYVNDWAIGSMFTNYAFIDRGDNPVPEPSTMLLLGVGLIGIAGATRKKLKR